MNLFSSDPNCLLQYNDSIVPDVTEVCDNNLSAVDSIIRTFRLYIKFVEMVIYICIPEIFKTNF